MEGLIDAEIENVIALFHKDKPESYQLKDIRLENNDSRWVLFICRSNIKHVIKIASNGFTTQERVNGWNNIIAEYGKMGYYSPAILRSLDGNFAETISFRKKQCVVWEEEFANYQLFNAGSKNKYISKDGKYIFHDEVFEFVGKVAQRHFDHFPFPSGWVRLKPFGGDETCDEVTECVRTFDRLVRNQAPKFLSRWEKILAQYNDNKAKLENIYGSLPTSVFQADTADNNLLLDGSGHFRGVIDYNLAGKDTVINIFLSMILFGYSYHRKHVNDPQVLPELNIVTQNSIIDIMLETLRYLRNFYTFNELEATAAPLLYKYISTVEYAEIQILEKYTGDDRRLNLLFDFMESQLLRDDIDFYDAMLG